MTKNVSHSNPSKRSETARVRFSPVGFRWFLCGRDAGIRTRRKPAFSLGISACVRGCVREAQERGPSDATSSSGLSRRVPPLSHLSSRIARGGQIRTGTDDSSDGHSGIAPPPRCPERKTRRRGTRGLVDAGFESLARHARFDPAFQGFHELLVRKRGSRAAAAGGLGPQDERIRLHVLDDFLLRAAAPVPGGVLHLLADLLWAPPFP